MYTARRAGHDSGNQVLRNRGFGARIRSTAETVKKLRSLPRRRLHWCTRWCCPRCLRSLPKLPLRRRSLPRRRPQEPQSTAEAATKTPGYRGGGVQSTRVPRRRRPGPIRPPGPNPSAQTALAKTAFAGKVPETGGENQNLVTRPRRYKKWGQRVALCTKMMTRAPGSEQAPRKIAFKVFPCCVAVPRFSVPSPMHAPARDTVFIS